MSTKSDVCTSQGDGHSLLLSIVVVMYNMQREAERTLLTLSDSYQRRIVAADYEVLVIDNGSSPAVSEADVTKFGPNFRLVSVELATCSPVAAVNLGLQMARGKAVAVMVDGARMLSPGVVFWTLEALRLCHRAVVTVPSWHLGPDVQNRSIPLGYNQNVEDSLLDGVDWQSDGYRLFECCERLDPSCEGAAWFDPMAESNFIACDSALVRHLGGFEAKFISPGGGACNLDFFKRLIEDGGCPVVTLIGEGTFHQVHGGISTNVAEKEHPWNAIQEEYRSIYGHEWFMPEYEAIMLGTMSRSAKSLLARSPNIFTETPTDATARWFIRSMQTISIWIGCKIRSLTLRRMNPTS